LDTIDITIDLANIILNYLKINLQKLNISNGKSNDNLDFNLLSLNKDLTLLLLDYQVNLT
jgi:hypothetical protein